MDVLFNTINVRDLLSANDLNDPTSPLSAPDLRLLIQRLDSHSLKIKSQVRSYLTSHQPEFSALFALGNDIVSRTDDISDHFQGVMQLISDHPVDLEVRNVVSEIDEKMKEAKVKKELLGLVRAIWGLIERLNAAKEAVRSGRLRIAAEELRELKLAVNFSNESDKRKADEPLVYGLLKKELQNNFEGIQEVLTRLVEKAIQYEPESKKVRVLYGLNTNGVDGIDLSEVLEALDVVGLLDYGLARVADLMIKYVFTPAINSAMPIAFIEELHKGPDKINEACLRMVHSSCQETGTIDSGKVFSEIIQVIKFTCKYICFQNVRWIQSFGKLMWPRMSELIISNILSKVVPDDASKLTNFQKTIELTSEFQTALNDLHFISASDSKDNRLTNFAENVEVHFAAKKKKEILVKARNLLHRCDFTVPQDAVQKKQTRKSNEAGANPSDHVVDFHFMPEKCLVSTAASALMQLVHQTLHDVCLSSPRVALELYHAARDAIILYEAIFPVTQERQLYGINQVAVLMHNDFLYMSQEILGLAFQYRQDFPNPIKEYAVFVDLAPKFRQMAEEILHGEVQVIIFNLKEAIDGADGFQNTHQMQQFESPNFSIDVVFILEKVHIIWEPIMVPSTYYKSMGTVLESAFSRIVKDMLFLDDMAAEETLQLQRLIFLMLESLSPLLESLEAMNHDAKSDEPSFMLLDNLIPSLKKIRKLGELLDMPLRLITSAWESGELSSCGFTLSEVKDFIRAIFTDSPLRRECLSMSDRKCRLLES